MSMNTFPNQKTIKIYKNTSNKPYITVSTVETSVAMQSLKPNTFKVWMYLCKNKSGYNFALSCVDACMFCNISPGTFHSAINELIDKRYLVLIHGNAYEFNTSPKPEEHKEDSATFKF